MKIGIYQNDGRDSTKQAIKALINSLGFIFDEGHCVKHVQIRAYYI